MFQKKPEGEAEEKKEGEGEEVSGVTTQNMFPSLIVF